MSYRFDPDAHPFRVKPIKTSIKRFDAWEQDKHHTLAWTPEYSLWNLPDPPFFKKLRRIDKGVANRYKFLYKHEHVWKGSYIGDKHKYRRQQERFINWLFRRNFPARERDKIIKILNEIYKELLNKKSS
tara:strand:+ start:923 stop:1309 length:387 start_codon:yes stop_codon:yes gene_type:complete